MAQHHRPIPISVYFTSANPAIDFGTGVKVDAEHSDLTAEESSLVEQGAGRGRGSSSGRDHEDEQHGGDYYGKMTASTGLLALTFASPLALREAAIPCRLFHLP
jgi:hypothetical protein